MVGCSILRMKGLAHPQPSIYATSSGLGSMTVDWSHRVGRMSVFSYSRRMYNTPRSPEETRARCDPGMNLIATSTPSRSATELEA